MKLIFKIFKKVRELKREERRLIRNIKLRQESELYLSCYNKNKAIDYFAEMKNEMEIKKESLDQREKELNNLQDKINDQILRIASLQEINNE